MRHERMALGMVLTPAPLTTRGPCLNCGLDADGCTVETWKMFDDPGDTYPMCFWCLELWETRGWLRAPSNALA